MNAEPSQVKVTLPDGDTIEVPHGSTVGDLAAHLSSRLAKKAVAGRIDGDLCDLSRPLTEDIAVTIVVESDPEALEILRHTASHVMAQAVIELFPEAKPAIGPAIADGFYYDFDVENPFTEDDLAKIEARMREIIGRDVPISRRELSKAEARAEFAAAGQDYKVELLDDMPGDGMVSIYDQGDFSDLCRGPHLASTGRVKAFKLLSVAGAYWRGDEHKAMLQRIYGTAFPNEKQLKEHLRRLEEAKARDHRVLGRELDLYSVHEQFGAGLIHWHPRGSTIRCIIEDFWRDEHFRRGYDLVFTPHIARQDLWEKTGHLEFYRENMYAPMDVDGIRHIIKPMNCPGHIFIYKTKIRSYRDLPIRYAELGTVYRYERSGVLHGMLRVRGFTQDDAHIFCTPQQLAEETYGVLELADYMMKTFGFNYRLYLSTRPEKSVGSNEVWERATEALRAALTQWGADYTVDPGEGVFYGPKIDVKLIDALEREWQGPTIQVDFNEPERLDVNFVNQRGEKERVVMVHRTVLGSMERFIGVLIEHYGGSFPVWLAPVQVALIPVATDHHAPVLKMANDLREALIRTHTDCREESLGLRIREAEKNKIPYMIVVGDRELAGDEVPVRRHGSKRIRKMTFASLVARIQEETAARRDLPWEDGS